MSPGSTLDLFTLHCLYVFICWMFDWVSLTNISNLKLIHFRINSIYLALIWFMVFPASCWHFKNYLWSLLSKYPCPKFAKEVRFDHTLWTCLNNCFESIYNCSRGCWWVPSSMNAVIYLSWMFSYPWKWNLWWNRAFLDS